MKKTLYDYLTAEKVRLELEHIAFMDETMGVFNVNYDLLETEE
jgi:hypothetical protein